MFCPKCGAQVDNNATVCPACHSAIARIEQPQDTDAWNYYVKIQKLWDVNVWSVIFGTIGIVAAVLYPIFYLMFASSSAELFYLLSPTSLTNIVFYSAGFGLALSLIGQKKNARDPKCKIGFLMSAIALALTFVINFIYYTTMLF